MVFASKGETDMSEKIAFWVEADILDGENGEAAQRMINILARDVVAGVLGIREAAEMVNKKFAESI